MPEYLSPGVYVEEVDRGPRPIEGVGTAMPVFVGFTEKASAEENIDGEIVSRNLLNKTELVTNMTQFKERFGGFVEGAYLPNAVYGYFLNGGNRCYVHSVKTTPKAEVALLNAEGKPQLLVRARQSGFDGLRLRVKIEYTNGKPPVAPKKSPAKGKEGDPPPKTAPKAPATDPFTLIVERQGVTGAWMPKETLRDVVLAEVETAAGEKEVRVTYKNNKAPTLIALMVPLDTKLPLAKLWPAEQEQTLKIQQKLMAPATYGDFQGDVQERAGIDGLAEFTDITMVVVPDLMTVMPGKSLDLDMVKAVQTAIIGHCEMMGDRVAILDSPPNMSPQQIKKWRVDTAGFDSSYAALYYPWIEIMDPVNNRPMKLPPSGHIAGVWARSDNTRGVHKAPANEVIRGALGLTNSITKGEHDTLNPVGVNCVRIFPGMGIRIWGARTLSSNPLWRYINIRRLFNYVEKSIELGTMWTVFEPNDPALWGRIRRDVGAFLSGVWRSGALFGGTPSEAFYVKCDEEINPPEQRDVGQLVVEIGMAPVKPAEFVIFRISQWAPGAGE
ncbi:MAG TPA: phage tail sheath family protein [Chloroflexi bacterium]|nr:phage tail sheath family protein [Chloroflexota bacterium]